MSRKYYYLFCISQHGKLYLDNIGRWVSDISKADVMSLDGADSARKTMPHAQIGTL